MHNLAINTITEYYYFFRLCTIDMLVLPHTALLNRFYSVIVNQIVLLCQFCI